MLKSMASQFLVLIFFQLGVKYDSLFSCFVDDEHDGLPFYNIAAHFSIAKLSRSWKVLNKRKLFRYDWQNYLRLSSIDR